MKERLDSGLSAAIGVLGDSTGNERGATAEWPELFIQRIASQYPSHNVKHTVWNDATQAYSIDELIQAGPLGERKVSFAKSLIIDATLAPHIAGDIDVQCKVAMTDWTPAGNQNFVSKFGGAGSRCWRFYINSAGNLVFEWSNDGTAQINKVATANTGLTDGAVSWIRVTLDVDNGAAGSDVKFWKSSDGVTWTQIGSTVTTAGVATVVDIAAQPFEIGARSISSELMLGNMYEVKIRNGIDGPIVAPVLPELWERRDDTSYTFTGSPTLFLVNGSHPGAGISYLNDTTRRPKLNPDYGQTTIILSDSHNESFRAGERFRVEYEAWIDSVMSLRPMATIVLSTQNQRKSPATFIEPHAVRQQIIKSVASKRRLSVIDTYKAFNGDDTLVSSDGIHPTKGSSTVSGSVVWAREAFGLFNISAL